MNYSYFWLKIIATVPITFLAFQDDHIIMIWGIILIVIVDTILGISVAIKYKRFLSYKLGRATAKIGRYGVAMISMWILTVAEPSLFGWTFHFLGVFIILTEVLSNLEKLALLGMIVPTKLISLLNDEYKKFNTNNRKKVVTKILDSRDK